MNGQLTERIQGRILGGWHHFIGRIGGDLPDQRKLESLSNKSLIKRYKNTACALIATLLLMIGPKFVGMINGVPGDSELETIQVRVIRTSLKEPHFLVEFPDGRKRGMEWPVPISAKGGFNSNLWTDDERQRLLGCLVEIRGVPLRWTVNDRFRVWELNCPGERIHIPLSKTRSSHAAEGQLFFVLLPIYLIWAIFLVCIFIREKRGNL